MSDKQIMIKKKNFMSLGEILKYRQSTNPFEDELISLVHIARICYENDDPFEEIKIEKVFEKNYISKYHGFKDHYRFFLQGFSLSQKKQTAILTHEKEMSGGIVQNGVK